MRLHQVEFLIEALQSGVVSSSYDHHHHHHHHYPHPHPHPHLRPIGLIGIIPVIVVPNIEGQHPKAGSGMGMGMGKWQTPKLNMFVMRAITITITIAIPGDVFRHRCVTRGIRAQRELVLKYTTA